MTIIIFLIITYNPAKKGEKSYFSASSLAWLKVVFASNV